MSFLSRLLGGSGPDSSGAASDTLSPADFVARRDPAAPVLDVRTPGEFGGGHLSKATNVDVMGAGFADQIRLLEKRGVLQKDRPVYLYCRSGNRSGKATKALRQMGFEGAVNVGGFSALRSAGADTAA